MSKKTFSTIVLAMALVLSHVPAFAQEKGKEYDLQMEEFKKKIATARGVGGEEVFEDDDMPVAGASPLGPAASLPVKGPAAAAAAGGAAPALSPMDMQARMDAEAQEQKSKLEQQAFDTALKQMMPLRPDQIRTTYEKFEESRKAAETPLKIPEMKTQIETVSLDPGQPPPVIRMVPGYVTTVSILDSSGAPWPIQDISYTGDFDLTSPENGGNVLRMTPSSTHGVGNMSVRMVDLVTPIIFTLTTSIDVVYYRFEARIAKNGPLAKTPIIEFGGLNAVAGGDGNLVAVLDGTLPSGAEKLKVQGVDGRTSAWRVGDRIYLRTPLSLLSPAWEASAASSDGTTVYTINDTPVVLLSDEGRMVRAHIATADEVTP